MTAIELRAELFREMSPLLDNESAMTKMLAFVKSLVPAKKTKTESDWANRFVGAWKDSRSAEEIISDIRESRTANSREFELRMIGGLYFYVANQIIGPSFSIV